MSGIVCPSCQCLERPRLTEANPVCDNPNCKFDIRLRKCTAGLSDEQREDLIRQQTEKREREAEEARIRQELREAQERSANEQRARLKAEAEARMLIEEMERRTKEEEKREREEKLKAMTPVQRLLHEFDEEIDELHKHDSHCLYRED